MPEDRLPKRLFYGELQQGKRSHGGQKKRFKDTLKTSLKAFVINPDSWELAAADRLNWRSAVHKGAELHEMSRTVARKERIINPPADTAIACSKCSRTLRAQIGLISHLRTHR